MGEGDTITICNGADISLCDGCGYMDLPNIGDAYCWERRGGYL